jgi:hypothetical protein
VEMRQHLVPERLRANQETRDSRFMRDRRVCVVASTNASSRRSPLAINARRLSFRCRELATGQEEAQMLAPAPRRCRLI